MGSTRRTFFLSYLLVQALYNAGNYILLVLLVLSEKKIRSFLIAQDITVGKKAELIWPWSIRYGFPALLVFTIVSILFGTLWMYFGKVAGVILWILWMALCLGDSNIADAVTDAPDSVSWRNRLELKLLPILYRVIWNHGNYYFCWYCGNLFSMAIMADGKILNKSSKLPASIEKIIEKITIREFICVGGSLNLPVYNQIYHALQKN